MHELLCDCLCLGFDRARVAKLDQLSHSDWEHIVEHAIGNNVVSLLYYHIQAIQTTLHIPADILAELQQMYLSCVARNLYVSHQLFTILTVLRNEHIPVILLKGAYLEEVIYGSLGLRTMADIDILVKKEDLARSQRVLLQAGYLSGDSPFPVDMHWNIDLSIAHLHIDIEHIWERAHSTVIHGIEVLELSAEDLLLHLCLHLSFHHSFQFVVVRTLCDIREVIQHYGTSQIRWEQLEKQAKEWGMTNSVYLTFALAKDMLDAPICDDFLERIRPDNFDPQIKILAIEHMLGDAVQEVSLSPYFWELWSPGTFKEKMILLRYLLFPPAEFISQKYPASFRSFRNYVYYVVRLKDHVLLYTRILWRMLRGDAQIKTLMEQERKNMTMRKWLASGQH